MLKRLISAAGLVLVLALALCTSGGATLRAVSFAPADPNAALKEMNAAARAAYARARTEALAGAGPVVLYDGDQAVLRYSLQRWQARTTPALYHDLKTSSHVALGLHALLVHHTGKQLKEDRLFDLRRYRELVLATGKALRARELTKEQLARHDKLARASLELLESALKAQRVKPKALVAYARRVRPMLEAHATEAARAQLDGLHRQMMAWKAKLTQREWEQLTAIVMGSPMPRRDHVAVQYFSRLLGEKGEGKRIIYAESLFDEARALNLLGTKLLDTRIGEDFFDEPLRMHRDLLGEAARAHLEEMFKKGKE